MSETWAPVPEGSDFPIENLPFGVFRPRDEEPRVGVRIGDHVVDLARRRDRPRAHRPPVAQRADGERPRRRGARPRRRAAHRSGAPRPAAPDRRASTCCCRSTSSTTSTSTRRSTTPRTSAGSCARTPSRCCRTGASCPSPTTAGPGRSWSAARRSSGPKGSSPDGDGPARLAPTRALDIELEVGFVVGGPPAARIEPDHADRHVFGVVLLNDWSARDIQAFEYQPLGPHLAKSFATTISPWVVTLDALRPYLVEPPAQDPPPDPYLRAALPWGLDLDLTVELNGERDRRDQLPADVLDVRPAARPPHGQRRADRRRRPVRVGHGRAARRTGERGSLIELTWRGAEPLDPRRRLDADVPRGRRHRHAARLVRWRRPAARSASARRPGTIVATPGTAMNRDRRS